MSPHIIWICGKSGSGKTTTSKLLAQQDLFTSHGLPILLDGDELREIFGNKTYHDPQIRKDLAYQYFRLAQLFHRQGHNVIISAVGLYPDVHTHARAEVDNYLVIRLLTNETVLRERHKELDVLEAESKIRINYGNDVVNNLGENLTIDTSKVNPIEAVLEIVKYISKGALDD